MKRVDLRATWTQALVTLLAPLVVFFTLRWLVAEPFVIPSGSMIPTLLVHDHILVNKLAYGAHFPFSKKWLMRWSSPKRGDIVVFRYPPQPDVFYVKRVIGLPGDRVVLDQGVLKINGQEISVEKYEPPPIRSLEESDSFEYFKEESHLVRYRSKIMASSEEVVVPEKSYFMLGDNRDQSQDSRYWGFVPEENLVGRAWLVWLACAETLPSAQFLCDPKTLRWDRVLIRPN